MKLEQIKRHPDFPFRDFQSDDLQFLMLELYWAELLRDSLPESVAADWGPEWAADPEDGSPILSVSNRKLMPPRMLRIIQSVNNDQFPELDLETWEPITYRGDAYYIPCGPSLTYGKTDQDLKTPIEELVIFSEVSEVCERMVRDYIRLWCVERISEKQMEVVVEAYDARLDAVLIDPEEDEDQGVSIFDRDRLTPPDTCIRP
ncbi:hypothetical protein [Candidatus Thiosymbion oneisti]|uniref:hypothetical protein n=1 Tax=Candidatus Thiosymbion oneisti TaxID=589554 RepID=UPI000B7ED185|nr:hypothetical protein [Candidatus Thiosymbion oneisti]